MLLVDDYTRMTAVFFLRNKSEAFENFKVYKEMVENEMYSKIKCLRSDNGGVQFKGIYGILQQAWNKKAILCC